MKQKNRAALGIVFALACGAITWLLIGAPGLRSEHPQAVETVRVVVEGLEYHIPAQLAPSFEPSDAVQSWWKSSTYHYSQELSKAPPHVTRIRITKNALRRLSDRDASYSRLGKLSYIAVIEPKEVKEVLEKDIDSCQMPRPSVLRDGRTGSQSILGNFRVEEVDRALYLRQALSSSTPITGWCPIGLRKPKSNLDEHSLVCWARQRMPSGSCVEIAFLSRFTPIETLEETFAQVERLVGSLVCDTRLGAAPNFCK